MFAEHFVSLYSYVDSFFACLVIVLRVEEFFPLKLLRVLSILTLFQSTSMLSAIGGTLIWLLTHAQDGEQRKAEILSMQQRKGQPYF